MAILSSGMPVSDKTLRHEMAEISSDGQLKIIFYPYDRFGGVAVATSGIMTAPTSAHAANAGWVYLFNPSSREVTVRRIEVQSVTDALAATIAAWSIERFTFSGEPSVSVAAARSPSTELEPLATWTTTSTGTTITPGRVIYQGFLSVALTSAMVGAPSMIEWEPRIKSRLILGPKEGLLVRQTTTGDVDQILNINIAWEEI